MWLFIRCILDFLFPYTCVECGLDGDVLCNKCTFLLKFDVSCIVFPGKSAEIGLDTLFPMYIYEKRLPLAKLLHQYKYEGCPASGKYLQKLFLKTFKSKISDSLISDIDFYTWVPLTNRKYKKRGFNQSSTLANALGMPKKVVKLLGKVTENQPQMSLDKERRKANVRGVYEVVPSHLQNLHRKNIVIIDDVATTLSTLNECARVLKTAGANKVYGLVLARQGV